MAKKYIAMCGLDCVSYAVFIATKNWVEGEMELHTIMKVPDKQSKKTMSTK